MWTMRLLLVGIAVLIFRISPMETFRIWRPDNWEHAKCIPPEVVKGFVKDLAIVGAFLAAAVWIEDIVRLFGNI